MMRTNMLVYKRKRALILKLKDINRITTVIPTAKVINYKGHDLVAVPHRVDETTVLRNMGIETPSPIRYAYDWSGPYTPFSAQVDTAEFLTLHRRAFCLNDMGTGKTSSTLWAYDFLRSEGLLNKMLVTCPLSTMERTWGDEIFRNFPHLTFSVLHGSRDKRLKLLDTDADIYIVNHHGMELIADALKDRADINVVTVDELGVFRNASTDLWKAANKVVNKQQPRWAWGLTGTPIPTSPTDAWAQCRLLVPERVPPYFNKFKTTVMRQVSNFTWLPREDAISIVEQAMQPAIRFSRAQCVDLPPCLYETLSVELSAPQKKAYKEMMNSLRTEDIVALNEAVKLNKLLQIVCGVAYDQQGNEVSFPSPARLAAVHEVVESASGKVIVFVPFVSAIAKVAEYLTSKGITVECIHGGVSKGERDRIFRSFQQSADPRVIVAQPAAMSHGLTLTAANTVVWYAPITSNDIEQQANARVTRPGQKLNQLIVRIEGSPVERKLYARLQAKQSVQGLLLDLVQNA